MGQMNLRWHTDDLPHQLSECLSSDVSAYVARGLSPALSFGRHQGPAQPDSRHAAVMILIYREDNKWMLPLTLRQSHLSAHPNQISLPGGSVDAGESNRTAAIREMEEELGFRCREENVLGTLAPVFVFNSNFLVHPWVSWTAEAPEWKPNPAEVAEIICVPLTTLLDTKSFDEHTVHRGRLQFAAPSIRVGKHQIWGATRVILAGLAACLTTLDR